MGRDTNSPRRVVVVGAGGLGSVYGAALARSGADVQLLARRAHAEAVRRAGGVRVLHDGSQTTVPLRAHSDPQRVEPADTVLLACKSHDSAVALAGLGHIAGGVTLAFSIQNGVEKTERLSEWCGEGQVVGAMSMVGATLDAPGRVSHTLTGTTYLGELPAGGSERVRALAADLQDGGLPVVVSERIAAVEWSKLVHAAPTMTITALARLPMHRALQDDGLARLYVALLHEGAALAERHPTAWPLEDLPGMFPVARLAAADPAEAVAWVRERGRAMERAGATGVITSMLEDVRSGRRLELDAIHGFLVDRAEAAGLPVPRGRVCLDLLRAIDPWRGQP